LLGAQENGCWRMAPTAAVQRTSRQYRGNTLILDTMQALAQHKAVAGQIANDVMTGRKTRSEGMKALQDLPDPMEAFKASQGKGGKPPGPTQTQGARQPVRVSTPDEARKLAPGTPIILPDGSEGVVP
jgi:hypothetical protein